MLTEIGNFFYSVIFKLVSNTFFYITIFTILISIIDIKTRTKSRVDRGRAFLGLPFLFFLFIYIIGNSFAALIAPKVVDLNELLTSDYALSPILVPFLYGFLSVFAFQGILANTNITFFAATPAHGSCM